MFRLMIVSGPNRGSSYTLVDGENSIGRQMDNHIVLSSAKVSKRHCALLVTAEEVFLRDESSTNGTFVNGSMVRKQTLKPGDKLSVGDFVMELVRVGAGAQAAMPMIQMENPMMMGGGNMGGALAMPMGHQPQHSRVEPLTQTAPVVEAPKDLPGQIQFAFEGKFMPNFYGMLMKTEYRSIVAMVIAAVVAIAVVGSIMPMEDLAEKSIQREATTRARVIAREVADRFLPAIASHIESQIDLSQLENEESVKLVAITNTNMQIIAPQSRLNQLLAGGKEASFAIMMAKEFKEGREKGAGAVIGDSVAVYVEPIKTTDPRQVKSQISAMVVVAIDFSGNLLQTGGLGVAYGTGFVVAGLMGILAYFIILRLSFKPYEVLNDDLDQVLRGELPKVTHEFKIEETSSLWDNINATIQRIPKGGGNDFSSGNDEVMVNWDYEFAGIRAMAEATQSGFIGFDSNSVTVALNPQFEEISGVRSDVIGQALQQVARDQAFVMLVNDLKDRVESSPSRSALDDFEFSGVAYQVIATGAGPASKSGFALVFRKKE
jgi:PAS domain-containing protein